MNTPEKPAPRKTSSQTTRKRAPASKTAAKPRTSPSRKPAASSAKKEEPSADNEKPSANKESQELKKAAHSLKRQRTPFEWALLLVALAAIGTIVVGLFLYAGAKSGGEAELEVEVADTGKQFKGGPQIEVTVRNVGGSGAEEIVTEVSMGEETREVTMLRIPKDDEASAIVTFPAGTTGTPEGELLSYNTP